MTAALVAMDTGSQHSPFCNHDSEDVCIALPVYSQQTAVVLQDLPSSAVADIVTLIAIVP